MKKCKILMVDDEPIVLRGFSLELSQAGFEVKTAHDAYKALELIKKESFDISFVDLVMPGIDGVELCENIKKYAPKTEVVLLSGQPQDIEEKQIEFLKVGGRDVFLRKPLLENELVSVADQLCKERHCAKE